MSGSQAFPNLSCEDGFLFESAKASKQHHLGENKVATGIESYKQTLVRLAQSSLEVEYLSSRQIQALENYHHVIQGERGRDGTFARVENYTVFQVKRIVEFLQEFFSPEQVETLIEDGVVEINRSSYSKATGVKIGNYVFSQVRRVVRFLGEFFSSPKLAEFSIENEILGRFNKGKKVFIQIHDTVFRISKILDRTNSGFFLETERVDEQGRIIKKKIFLITSNVNASLVDTDFANIIKISEKTNNGFVINVLKREYRPFRFTIKKVNQVFFSFEKAIENGLLPDNPTAKDYRELEDMISSYISRSFDQIPNSKYVPYWMNDIVIEGSHFTVPPIYRCFIRGVYNFRLAHPESEAIFLAASSARKRIDSNELYRSGLSF